MSGDDMTLVEFLRARLGEDAHRAKQSWAEVEAKRAIIDSYADNADPGTMAHSSLTLEWVCAQLALPYADHPDYQESWKP